MSKGGGVMREVAAGLAQLKLGETYTVVGLHPANISNLCLVIESFTGTWKFERSFDNYDLRAHATTFVTRVR